MRKVIAIVNQKGGTGKTTTTANLAFALAAMERRILCVDADPQASLTFYLGQDERRLEQERRTLYWALHGERPLTELVVAGNPALVPSSITLAKADAELLAEPGATWVLKEKLDPLRPRYDLVLIDCPPTLTLLTVNALAAADGVLIPVKTDLLSTLGVPQLLETVGKIQRRANPDLAVLGIVPTLFNARFAHDAEVLAELGATFGRRFRLFEPIGRSTSFDRAAGSGQPTVALEPGSPGALAYRRLAAELLETLG
jgi:chromosome partitioning protein